MSRLRLELPRKEHQKEALEYKREHFSVGECELHGSSLLDKMDSYDAWLEHLQKSRDERTAAPAWVAASTFFVVRVSDDRIVGMIDIRHRLNDFLRSYGGHIGYGVRPSERKKGYATELLRLGLEYCRTIGLTEIMLACYKDNQASSKTILQNGGILEKEFLYSDGKTVQVYWIRLKANLTRCPWAGSDPLYRQYHDTEWGVPVYDDRKLFEFLLLEGAQAGLSWITILRKRENYRHRFAAFDPERLAAFGEAEITAALADPGIIRNRRKVAAAVQNARAFLDVAGQYKSFTAYIWQFVEGTPRQNVWRSMAEIPVYTREAELMSRELVRRGFKFVGPTICYSFMQAVGMVNDHLVDCFRHEEVARFISE